MGERRGTTEKKGTARPRERKEARNGKRKEERKEGRKEGWMDGWKEGVHVRVMRVCRGARSRAAVYRTLFCARGH